MGLIHSPRTVTDGLIVSVDFLNIKSINTSSFALTDMSRNNFSISITYAASNTLNVTDGYAEFTPSSVSSSSTHYTISDSYFSNIATETTLEACVYIYNDWGSSNYSRPVSTRIVEAAQPNGFGVDSTTIRYEVNTTTGWKTGATVDSRCGLNKWIYVTQTTSVTTDNFLTYLNGDLVATISLAGSTPNPGGGLLIGKGFYAGHRYFNGRVAFTKIYNRALSPAEIKQNFNALRGRFGL